ncbi:MAG: hypothetical protein K8U57_23095 [Planctomycetes bacterium]|nr:hypothetical protein [Planctomycetota bacterium]
MTNEKAEAVAESERAMLAALRESAMANVRAVKLAMEAKSAATVAKNLGSLLAVAAPILEEMPLNPEIAEKHFGRWVSAGLLTVAEVNDAMR